MTESGPKAAMEMAKASLIIGWIYSGLWAIAYLFAGDAMLSIYRFGDSDPLVEPAIAVASGLLIYVAMYIVADATQLVMAGVLRGAGDTWFVLLAGFVAGTVGLAIGWWGESPPIQGDTEQASESLQWWWQVILMWIWILSGLMTIRFAGGRWKTMRMVDREDA